MLVETDINELGDRRLDPKEAVARETEDLLKLASTRKIHGQAELEDVERSSGSNMAWQELIRRIRLCNPSLHFADSQGGNHIAVYRAKNRIELAETDKDPDKHDWWNDHIYVTGFEKKELPEFSHVLLDTSHLPTREVRGWRSVLIALVKASAITYASTVKHFGRANGVRANRWLEQLQKYHNE